MVRNMTSFFFLLEYVNFPNYSHFYIINVQFCSFFRKPINAYKEYYWLQIKVIKKN